MNPPSTAQVRVKENPPATAASRRADDPANRGALRFAWVGIVAATIAAYHNSFYGPFVFDDLLSIRDNATLGPPLWRALVPPAGAGLTVEGRPLLNFSFALNRLISGQSVWSYHEANLAIHVGAALALFGVIRRSLRLRAFDAAWRQSAGAIAFATALLWAVHPVQTESVTYLVQRAESLMGMWFLLSFYGFVRGAAGGSPRWYGMSIGACYAAALTKEVAVAIPVLVLLYDCAFVSGGWQAAWQARRKVHVSLFSSWLVVAALVAGSGSRGGTVGFGSQVAWWDYAWTQVDAIVVYLRLVFWPAPLIFDYGVAWVHPTWRLIPGVMAVLALLVGTALALVRWPKWGFLGLWFLAMLAPTSLIPGNRQTIAEHRIYLSLAAPLLAGVIGLTRVAGPRRTGWIAVALALPLVWLVVRRNADYRSDVVLYADTVAKRPGNAFAHYNLGKALAESGDPARAIAVYQNAAWLDPAVPAVHYNLGNAFAALGRHEKAVTSFERALALSSAYALARYNLGNSLVALGRRTAAREQFAAAVQSDPEFVDARANLAGVLLELGELDRSATEFAEVLRRDPLSTTARFNLAQVFRAQGKLDEARRELETALKIDPKFEPARAALLAWGQPKP